MFLLKNILYSVLVLAGVVVLIFLLFQGLGDPAKMMIGQTGNKETLNNIKKDLHLDQPVWKQLLLYVNDVSPVCVYADAEIKSKSLHGWFAGGKTKIGLKIPYLGKSYQSKKSVGEILSEALPGTLILA